MVDFLHAHFLLPGRTATERDWQVDFVNKQLTPERRAHFQLHIDHATHCLQYRFSPVPIAIERARYQRLVETAEAAIALMTSTDYQQHAAKQAWILPKKPIEINDCCGSVDFLLEEDDEKIIEVNPIPPGFVGYLELIDQARLEAYGAESPAINAGFEQAFVNWISEKGCHQNIIVAVNHTDASRPFIPHYRYIVELLCRQGIHAEMVFAKDLKLGQGGGEGIVWNQRHFTRIFNLVIPRIIEREPDEFTHYIELYHQRPELIFPNPFAWRVGNKSILCAFSRIKQESFGLSQSQQETLYRATLETFPLESFDSPLAVLEHFGGIEQLVLKPVDDYNRGGLYIHPSFEQLSQLMQEKPRPYVVQQYCQPPTTLNVTPDNRTIKQQFTTRLGYLNGKVFGLRGASWHQPGVSSWIAPFVVV